MRRRRSSHAVVPSRGVDFGKYTGANVIEVVHFRESQSSFRASKKCGEPWFDTSFSHSPRAVGRLRWLGVNNARYKWKHPVFDESGDTVGFIKWAAQTIGYTYDCVYAGGCFWISHMKVGPTMSGGHTSQVSLVDARGTFMFSTSTKFKVVKSFKFDGHWVHSVRAFKLLDDGANLLYLTSRGFCLFDTDGRNIVTKMDFENPVTNHTGFALSPNGKLLAIAWSVASDKDPLDGQYPYCNLVELYDLEAGTVLGGQALPGDRLSQRAAVSRTWAVAFSEDGRQLRVASQPSTHVFDLIPG